MLPLYCCYYNHLHARCRIKRILWWWRWWSVDGMMRIWKLVNFNWFKNCSGEKIPLAKSSLPKYQQSSYEIERNFCNAIVHKKEAFYHAKVSLENNSGIESELKFWIIIKVEELKKDICGIFLHPLLFCSTVFRFTSAFFFAFLCVWGILMARRWIAIGDIARSHRTGSGIPWVRERMRQARWSSVGNFISWMCLVAFTV